MNCPPNGDEVDLTAYWDFEEGTGTTCSDLSPNEYTGLLGGGASWNTNTSEYSCAVSAHEMVTDQFSVFPNPSTEEVQVVTSTNTEYELEFYSPDGRLIFRSLNFANTLIPNEVFHCSGLYFVKLTDLMSGKSVSIKIVRE